MASSMIFALLVSATAAPAPAPAPAPAQAAAPSQAAAKLVCKSTEVTGSLVKKRKVCQPKATWEKHSDSYKEQWSALQGTLGNSRGN